MNSPLHSWQRSAIRNSMERYRRAQDDYYGNGKALVEVDGGYKAFSLVSPPLGSPATRRRIRRIVDNMAQSGNGGAPIAARTPHVITIAVTYNCQCDCAHCSAVDYQAEDRPQRRSAQLRRTQERRRAIAGPGHHLRDPDRRRAAAVREDLRVDRCRGPVAQRLHHLHQRRVSDRAHRAPAQGSRPVRSLREFGPRRSGPSQRKPGPAGAVCQGCQGHRAVPEGRHPDRHLHLCHARKDAERRTGRSHGRGARSERARGLPVRRHPDRASGRAIGSVC